MAKHIAHWDDVEKKHREAGDIGGNWHMIGEAVESVAVGMRRIEVDPGKRSTALHLHGAEEEIFFVLGGSGLLYQGDPGNGQTCELQPSDCIVHLADGEPHTVRAGPEGIDLLAYGMRVHVEICHLPRAGMAWAGPTVVAAPGLQNLWALDDAAGPFEFPAPGERPANVVALADAPVVVRDKGPTYVTVRALGKTGGARRTGLNHLTLAPGRMSWPRHCHSAEEEMFVVLEGDGMLLLGEEEHPVRPGHVVSRPAGTGIAHGFRAGKTGMALLAYGTREPNDISYFPRSKKIWFRGVGLIGRIESLDYWDGEM